MEQSQYLYILVRQDLPLEQIIVQSSHLAWEISSKTSLNFHPCFVVIGVKNENELLYELTTLTHEKIPIEIFREPLFDNTITAIGFLSRNINDRKFMKKYRILKMR